MTQVRAEEAIATATHIISRGPVALIYVLPRSPCDVSSLASMLCRVQTSDHAKPSATIPQRQDWCITSSAASHKIATSFDLIDRAMTFESQSNEPPGTDETLNRMAAWRGSLEELEKSIGGLREKCAQLPEEDPREVTNFETDVMQSLYPRPVRPVAPLPLEPADPLLQEISKLEQEAIILRRIFGDKRLSADELKILTEVDGELAALRLQWDTDTQLSS